MTSVSDSEYLAQAEALLLAVELCCDAINDHSDADIDNQRVGAMLTLTFRNGSQIIVNLQKPLHEVWLAARAGGFHYQWQGGRWIAAKDGSEFYACLSRCASEQAGQPLVFAPPN